MNQFGLLYRWPGINKREWFINIKIGKNQSVYSCD